jgi:stearoyl-CoA desaturase (Delta-9 desaturase)
MFDIFLNWLANGLVDASGWQMLAFTLVVTHITIAAVTIYLHRHQAHRALELGPVPSHFFRLWLWMTTGMVTREWVAIHRKHHAKCETTEDPHSPVTRGINTVMWRGAELYRQEAANAETVARYSHGTPDDWVERNIYSRFSWQGVALMMIIDLALFGGLGLTIWAVQMVWIPFWAAGVINGIGHYWGYRNFEAADASTNVSPWGVLIGGEELHNNHHTYPTAAKFSVKPYEFDIGWGYIRAMEMVGWAKVRKIPPHLVEGETRAVADDQTLEALINNRYEVMARFAKAMRATVREELSHQAEVSAEMVANAKRWLHRDFQKVPQSVRPQLVSVLAHSPALNTMASMREELRQLWSNTTHTREQLVAELAAWCTRAEASGIAALQSFSVRLRSAAA